MATIEIDALPIEYKLKYGCARGHLSLSDIVDDSSVLREFGILGGGLQEQIADLTLVSESGSSLNNGGDFLLLGGDTV